MISYGINSSNNSQSGRLLELETKDGSLSLHSCDYKEDFHCKEGAKKETLKKFILPAQLNRFKNRKRIFVLDVCVGMGYNTALLLEELKRFSLEINWWGLEIDSRPLKLALEKNNFINLWTPNIVNILRSIISYNEWHLNESKGILIWGDARKTFQQIPKNIKFDLIMLDAFSPKKCPQLWSEEFLRSLAYSLAQDGRITSYCRAASVRSSLRRAGLQLRSLVKNEGNSKDWSEGTIAIRSKANIEIPSAAANWQLLSNREEEHLLTKAAIPYRDPSGKGNKEEILELRKKEQSLSNLKSTTAWRRRWSDKHADLGQ